MAPTPPTGLLVTDLDGTLTEHDVHRLVFERLRPAGAGDPWAQTRRGERTQLSALQEVFRWIADPAALDALLDDVGLPADLAALVDRLAAVGWEVAVVSAGCQVYVDRLLERAGVRLTARANPGRFVPGEGLVMEPLPADDPAASPSYGIDKAVVLRQLAAGYEQVAFAGDGLADLGAARLVPDHLRFARGELAEAAAREGLPTRPFTTWAEVAAAVVAEAAGR